MAIIMCAFTGIAIDVGRLYVTKAQLSRAVDAAALAGVLDLPDTVDACATAETYFADNEPVAGADADCTSPGENQLKVTGSKSVEMTFLKLIGIDERVVSAKATAGFGVLALDAALVIDATGSMDDGCNSDQDNAGCPVYEAKEAAKDFKDILLGTSPDGSTAVGATALRGCFRADPTTTTAPKPTSSNLCVLDDNTSSTWVTDLTYNLSTLDTRIGNILAEGGSGTNVCGGLAKGWEILDGPGNHLAIDNNLRYIILLSDGDNNYYGHYAYQTSLPSPHTYRGYSCQPPSSCSNVGGESSSSSNPCHDGVNLVPNTTTDELAKDQWTSACNNWSTGSGSWSGGWIRSSSPAPSLTSSSQPNDTSCHARIPGTGFICRAVDLSGATSVTLSYRAKDANTWDNSSDSASVRVSTSSDACNTGSGFTTVRSHTYSGSTAIGSSYNTYTANLDSYAGQTVYVRFQGAMTSTSDYLYVDTVIVNKLTTVMVETAADGYLNGHNGSPATCSTAVKRERQMDIRTWELIKAIKADEVEIYVVGFGVCDPDPDVDYTTAQCEAQIGNTDHDDIADERLLKCMASSDDHYFYAATASDLPTIFSQIAKQIGHRLIE
jgi:hypothetical protein